MTTWARSRALYLNVLDLTGADVLLEEKTNAPAKKQEFVLGDKFLLALYFRAKSSTADISEVRTLEGGSTIVVSAKLPALLPVSQTLFYADTFSLVGTGDDARYEGWVDLNTVNLAAAFQTNAQITCRMEVEVQAAGNTDRASFQFDAEFRRQVYSDEGVPSSGDPVYPSAASILLNNHTKVDIAAGASQVVVSGLGLGFVPATVLAWVTKPAGGANILAVLDHDSVGAGGFTVDLTAATPNANYDLHYLLIKEH